MDENVNDIKDNSSAEDLECAGELLDDEDVLRCDSDEDLCGCCCCC
jgi:hypothetical protein